MTTKLKYGREKQKMNEPLDPEKWWNCAICGLPHAGYGHNPDPVQKRGRCCSDCNTLRVIPARFEQLYKALGAQANGAE